MNIVKLIVAIIFVALTSGCETLNSFVKTDTASEQSDQKLKQDAAKKAAADKALKDAFRADSLNAANISKEQDTVDRSEMVPQKQEDKSLLRQLEVEEEIQKRKNIYQGQTITADMSLQKARENAAASVLKCPPGTKISKFEDIKELARRQEEMQQKIAASLERFTTKKIIRRTAISEFNQLVYESNQNVIWGRGKVTDGVCNSIKQTEIISKINDTTKKLFEEYRRAIQ